MRVISLKNYCESTRVVIQLLQYQNKVTVIVLGMMVMLRRRVMMISTTVIVIKHTKDRSEPLCACSSCAILLQELLSLYIWKSNGPNGPMGWSGSPTHLDFQVSQGT